MTKDLDLPKPALPRRIGRDELNLTEFPFALLSDRPSKNSPLVLQFKDGTKEWTISGHPQYGLPTPADVEVYIVLMELTREQNFPQHVYFTRHDAVKRLGWNISGRSYDRLILSLRRLAGVMIQTKNAFYDAKAREWNKERVFHILDAYEVNDSRQVSDEDLSLYPSWIRWSPELFQNLQSGHLKRLDVSLFLSLHSAISQALYRYLDAKRYDGKPIYRIGIRKLAWEHLGLSRNYNAAQIKRKLDVAHAELIECGFLAGVEYAPMRSQKGEEMAIYHFPAQQLPVKTIEAPADPLIAQLQSVGVSRLVAEELAAQSPDECRRQLEYLPFRKAANPGGALVSAIREQWAPPPEWMKQQTRRKSVKRVTAVEPTVSETAFEQWWSSLSESRQAELMEQAKRDVRAQGTVMRQWVDMHPDSKNTQAILRAQLRAYMQAEQETSTQQTLELD